MRVVQSGLRSWMCQGGMMVDCSIPSGEWFGWSVGASDRGTVMVDSPTGSAAVTDDAVQELDRQPQSKIASRWLTGAFPSKQQESHLPGPWMSCSIWDIQGDAKRGKQSLSALYPGWYIALLVALSHG